jgi:hypothetical protein
MADLTRAEIDELVHATRFGDRDLPDLVDRIDRLADEAIRWRVKNSDANLAEWRKKMTRVAELEAGVPALSLLALTMGLPADSAPVAVLNAAHAEISELRGAVARSDTLRSQYSEAWERRATAAKARVAEQDAEIARLRAELDERTRRES